MYRIEKPSQQIVYDFYKDYRQYILDGVDYFLQGKTVPLQLGGSKNPIQLAVGMDAGSPSETFMQKLKDPASLEQLMTCQPNYLPIIIDYVKKLFAPGSEELAMHKLTLPVYKHFYGNAQRIDHFFTIMRHIFVDWVFDGERNGLKVFDKLKFVQNVDLTICPYCGAEEISVRGVQRKNATNHAKPDLDHFLPKSKYPYLAMSYANLIPCSEPCNRQMKKTLDPLVTINPARYRLLNPYQFDNESVLFTYDFDNTSFFEKEAYTVKVAYPMDGILSEGYSQGLGIDDLYGRKRNLIVDMYKQMAGYDKMYQKMLVGMGVLANNVSKSPKPDLSMVLGYETNMENSRLQPYFKFKYDMALQMISDSRCGWPW